MNDTIIEGVNIKANMEPEFPEFIITRTSAWETVTPTNGLRFVDRGGKKILQQLWRVQKSSFEMRQEWRDVPLEVEGA